MARLMDLNNLIIQLDNWGVRDVLLPFLLIFTIIFAVLQKADIFGAGKKNMNVAVAVIIALMVVIPHVTNWYPSQDVDPVEIMNRAIPSVSIVVVAIVMLLILIGLFGGQVHLLGFALSGWITFVSIAIILIVFGNASNWWDASWFNNLVGDETVSVIIILLVFGILVSFIAGGDKEKKPLRLWEDLRSVFKK